MSAKKIQRKHRAKKTRMRIRNTNEYRLCVNRSLQHIYAQVIKNGVMDETIAAASSLDPKFKELFTGCTGNVQAAKIVGNLIAERALAAGIKRVAFDRNGFAYHGRISALAEAARAGGLQI